MKAHLSMDAVSGATLIAAALLLDEEDPEVRGTLAAIGAWEITAALLTRTETGDQETPRPTGAGMVESGEWSQQSMPAAPAMQPSAR